MEHVLESLPEIEHKEIETDDPAGHLLAVAGQYDLVVLGATASPVRQQNSIGPVADRILHESETSVVVLRTGRPLPRNFAGEEAGQTAISILVDKWFAENTYHADEFDDLEELLALKKQAGADASAWRCRR